MQHGPQERFSPAQLMERGTGSNRTRERRPWGNRGKAVLYSALLLYTVLSVSGCGQESPPGKLWHYHLEYRLTNTGQRTLLWVALPHSIPGRQTVQERRYSLRPSQLVERQGDSAALFHLVGARPSAVIVVEGDVWLHTAPAQPLVDSLLLDTLEGWSASRLHYRNLPAEDTYLQALRQGYGDCSEFADLTVEACERAGYAARRIEGISGPDSGSLAHAWTECITPRGWHRLDATRRRTEPDRSDREGYLQIDNLSHWPEFQGLRAMAARSDSPALRITLYAQLTPAY